MRQVRRWGRRIRWSIVAFDNGTGESYSLNDDPQRKMTEENESLKCAQGIVRGLVSTDICLRLDVGNAEMIELEE